MEGYFRLAVAQLVDHIPACAENVAKFDEVRINLRSVVAISSQKITLGEYFSHLIRLNTPEDVNGVFSILLNLDFLEQIKRIDTLVLHDRDPMKMETPVFSADDMANVQELFRLRHIYAHELAPRERVSSRKITNCISSGAAFLVATQQYLRTLLPPEA